MKHAELPDLPRIQDTKPDVFIIETLRPEDEEQHRYEGRNLADLLRLSGKRPKYFYFQEEKELPYIIHLFRQSQYRFLHFSSHGSATGIVTQSGEISYAAFAAHFKGHLVLRRTFFSACELGNELFSECLGGANKGMHSIVAPTEPILFAHAAAIFHTLYLSLFSEDDAGMSHKKIIDRLVALRLLFPVGLHFSGYNSKKDKWKHETIAGKKANNKAADSTATRVTPLAYSIRSEQ